MPTDIVLEGSQIRLETERVRMEPGGTVNFLGSRVVCDSILSGEVELRGQEDDLIANGGKIVMRKKALGEGRPGDVTVVIKGEEGDIELPGIASLLAKLRDLERRLAQLEAG